MAVVLEANYVGPFGEHLTPDTTTPYSFTDLVPLVDPTPYSSGTVPNSKLKCLNGELVATLSDYLFNLFVVGGNRVGTAPYCNEVYTLWKNSLTLKHLSPMVYAFPTLYSIKLPPPFNTNTTPEAITEYKARPSNNFPFDLELYPVYDSPITLYKSLGIPSGLALIEGNLHIVSTPIKGITADGELLFQTNNGSTTSITYPSIAIVGDTISFGNNIDLQFIDLLENPRY